MSPSTQSPIAEFKAWAESASSIEIRSCIQVYGQYNVQWRKTKARLGKSHICDNPDLFPEAKADLPGRLRIAREALKKAERRDLLAAHAQACGAMQAAQDLLILAFSNDGKIAKVVWDLISRMTDARIALEMNRPIHSRGRVSEVEKNEALS
jgi:hypothetical protein